jgi:hypothetical protein
LTFDEGIRLVVTTLGERRLPWSVQRAIRTITGARPEDPQTWLVAARRLRTTSRRGWAFRCYRRAARLRPDDHAIAEEVGLFGADVLGNQWSRSWPPYLVSARRDPARRERVDPILLRLARRLPAEASGLTAVACLLALIGGAWVGRGFQPIGRPLPDQHEPLPPYVGSLAALAILLAFLALLWLAIAPTRRFGREILRRALWPMKVVRLLAVVLAAVSIVFTLVAAWYATRHTTFEALALWAVGAYFLTLLVALFGVPSGTRSQAGVAVISELLKP